MTDGHAVPDRPDTDGRVVSDRAARHPRTGEQHVRPADESITAAMRTQAVSTASIIEWTIGGVPR